MLKSCTKTPGQIFFLLFSICFFAKVFYWFGKTYLKKTIRGLIFRKRFIISVQREWNDIKKGLKQSFHICSIFKMLIKSRSLTEDSELKGKTKRCSKKFSEFSHLSCHIPSRNPQSSGGGSCIRFWILCSPSSRTRRFLATHREEAVIFIHLWWDIYSKIWELGAMI